MPNPVVHWEIQSQQAPELQEFYSKLFDWHIDTNNDFNYGMMDPHAKGGINGGIGPCPDGNRVTVYIQVDDLQAYLDKAESLGGKTVTPPMEIPGVVILAHFTDPEGNFIGLVKG